MDSVILPISPQGQITIPKQWREALMRKKGSNKVQLTRTSECTFTLNPEPNLDEWLDSLRGSGKGLWGDDPDQYIQELRTEWQK